MEEKAKNTRKLKMKTESPVTTNREQSEAG